MMTERRRNEKYREGMVVFTNPLDSQIRGGVLDMDELLETGFVKLRLISDEAFRLRDYHLNLELSARKNLERRLSRPVLFGETIAFCDKDLTKRGLIKSFVRATSIFQTRNGNQVLLEGVINPDDPKHFYTEYFRNIEIPDEHVNEALPNVFMQAWIDFVVTTGNQLRFEFHSFHSVSDGAKQLDIGTVPWNRNNGEFVFEVVISDSDDDSVCNIILNPKKKSKYPDMELYRREAYMTDERSFYLLEFPEYKCVNPLVLKNKQLHVGRLYFIDCMWHQATKMYLVSKIVASKKSDTWPVDIVSQMLRCGVRALDKYPCFFKHTQFGYFDDPRGLLALLHLTKYKNTAISVAFSDPGPSSCKGLRFRIDRILGEFKNEFQDVLQEIKVMNARGVMIDKNRVFAAEHSAIIFRFIENSDLPKIGQRIFFNAVYSNIDNIFNITSWKTVPDVPLIHVERGRMVKKLENAVHLLFFIEATVFPVEDLKQLYYNEDFGVLDDNMALVVRKSNDSLEKFPVWVKLVCEDSSIAVLPRTTFHIIGFGETVPNDRVPIILLEQVELRNHYESEILRAAMEADAQLVANRIAANTSYLYENSPNNTSLLSITPNKDLLESLDPASINNTSVSSSVTQPFGANAGGYFGIGQKQKELYRDDHVFERKDTYNYENHENCSPHILSNMTLSTEGSIIEPSRPRLKNVPQYHGVVFSTDNPDYKYNVVETLTRLKHHIPHDDCGVKCSSSCPYMNELARLLVREPGFFGEAQERYPHLARELMKMLNQSAT